MMGYEPSSEDEFGEASELSPSSASSIIGLSSNEPARVEIVPASKSTEPWLASLGTFRAMFPRSSSAE